MRWNAGQPMPNHIKLVRAELRRRLLAVQGVPDMGLEGFPFKPTVGVPFVNDRIDKGSKTPMPCRVIEERDTYVVDLNMPRARSFSEGEDLAEEIAKAFPPASTITPASPLPGYQFGHVVSSMVRTVIPFDQWAQYPIRIEFTFRYHF